jgi:GAF domain-containing protein
MKSRVGAGGVASKARGRKAAKLKRRKVSDDAARRSSSAAGAEGQVARLSRELNEAREQQTATSEVLRVISGSPGDLQPVFDTMLAKATRLCEATYGTLWLYEHDGQMRMAALHGRLPGAFRGKWGVGTLHRPSSSVPTARVFETRRPVQITDLKKDHSYIERDPLAVASVDVGGIRSLIAVPMLKDGTVVGAMTIYRKEVRPFTEKQIELVASFAAQAVIAIENARLLNELRQSLEQQTGTAEVLRFVSSSLGDLEPVFATLLENAARICDAKFGNIFRWDGDALHLVATHNTPPAFADELRRLPIVSGSGVTGRLVATKTVLHVPDLAAERAYAERSPLSVAAVELGGVRTFVAVPMMKENKLIGAIVVYRQEVRPFTDKQIALVTNFAAQAVIAIENARLLNELRQRTTDLTQRSADLTEALGQQTATSEVLQVISSFPGNPQPVFAAMLENAVRICGASFGGLYRWDGDALHLVATHDTPVEFAEYRKKSPLRPNPKTASGRMVATKTVVHVADVRAEPAYIEASDPAYVAAVELGGSRTVMAVPMLKEDVLIGAILMSRQEVRPFTDKQIELVTNFAAQAVIAIENARLLNELRQRTDDLTQRTDDLGEALEQQTATSEVLQVISSSLGDLEPVFASMLENAVRICGANFGTIYGREDDALHLIARHDAPSALADAPRPLQYRPDQKTPLGRLLTTGEVIHVTDLAADQSYIEHRIPEVVAVVEAGGVRTALAVPMLKGKQTVGAFLLFRQEVRPFTDNQIGLVKNFATQAVIAIENTRLLKELRERTEDVEKLNQQLERRVSDQVGEIERMGRLRRFLPPQVADLIVASGAEKQLESHRREITALFCDLRGFTGFTESADAEDVMALLRDYHATIGEIIIKYSGTLERYAGDGVMVVFNDPVPVDNPALRAVQMALETREAMGALTEKWRQLGHDLGFGIGIAHGFATLGTIGFEGRFDYAAIGTVSNVASRLCDEAKPGQILISPRVFMAVKDAVTVEPVGEFTLKGIRRPLAAYNVLATKSAN